MATLEQAIAVAVQAHQGQLDKAGAPYILHPLRLMLQLDEDEARMAAVLHDVVEDTGITLADLRGMGFSETVLETLDFLTHRPEDSYEVYIRKIQGHALASRIKLLDLEDNMDVRRLNRPCGEQDWIRLKKYLTAWSLLKGLALA